MYTRILTALAVCGLAVSAAQAGVAENWDGGSHGWYYFASGVGDGDVALTPQGTGGHDGGAYVQTPLGSMTLWDEINNAYWFCYTYAEEDGSPLTPVDFNSDPSVSVYLRDDTAEPGSANLGGGSIHLWVGQYDDPDGEGGDDPIIDFFFYDVALTAGDAWTLNSFTVQPGSTAWTQLRNDGGVDEAADLLAEPQQWGFGIFNASSPPTGTLGLDDLTIIPEPSGGILLLLGAALAAGRRRMS